MIKQIIVAAALASLTGCLTAEQIEERKKQFEAEQKQWCAQRGAPEGSKDYYPCRRDLARLIAEDERHRDAERSRAVDAYLDREARVNRRSMTCRSSSFMGTVNTTCD